MSNQINGHDVEEILKGDFTANGWDGLDSPGGVDEETKKKMQQEQEEIQQAYRAVFDTEPGKKVLEDLLNRTLRKTAWNPQKDEKFGYYREGQNTLMVHIIQQINNALNQETSERKEKVD